MEKYWLNRHYPHPLIGGKKVLWDLLKTKDNVVDAIVSQQLVH
jgi:hypothetical protein